METKKDEKGMVCTTEGCATNNINEKLFEAFSISKEPIGKIIYFGDPMCSWCWGIANHLTELKEHYKYELKFELVMGGLRPGGGDKWDDSMKEMLQGHWNHVHERSGQVFNYELFNRAEFNYDTEPPSRAVRIIRDLSPEKEFTFFKEVQHAFYVENFDLSVVDSYKTICEKLDISFEQLMGHFNTEKYRGLVKDDFQKSKKYGIRGFPSVAIQIEDNVQLIANGYSTYENMKVLIDSSISSVKK